MRFLKFWCVHFWQSMWFLANSVTDINKKRPLKKEITMKNLMLNNNNKSMDMFKLLTLSDPSFFFFFQTLMILHQQTVKTSDNMCHRNIDCNKLIWCISLESEKSEVFSVDLRFQRLWWVGNKVDLEVSMWHEPQRMCRCFGTWISPLNSLRSYQ